MTKLVLIVLLLTGYALSFVTEPERNPDPDLVAVNDQFYWAFDDPDIKPYGER